MTEPPYSRYAAVYDRLGQAWFGRAAALETLTWLAAHGVTASRALDLCCGTGAASIALAEGGLSVVAIDRSSEMLAAARRKAEAAGLGITFEQHDVTSFSVDGPFQLVTAFYDSLNYLTGDHDLEWLCERVRQVISDDGWFVFDLNTRRKLEREWIGTMIAADDPDLFVVYDAWFDQASQMSPLRVTGFVRRGDDSWQRFVEEHVERAFSLEQVRATLGAAGFQTIHAHAFSDRPPHLGEPAHEGHSRWIIMASPAQHEIIAA